MAILHITGYVLNVECHVMFRIDRRGLQTHADFSHLLINVATHWWVKANIQLHKPLSYGKVAMIKLFLPVYLLSCSVHLGRPRHDCLMHVSIAGELQAAEIIQRSKVTQQELLLSGRLVNVTWLPDIHPSCRIMSVTGSKRPCVDLWSVLTSSTHLCKCAWLGHCMITWPCCRSITPSLSSWWGFLSRVKHIFSFFFFLFFFAKKKKQTMTRTLSDEMFIAMHIR